MQSIIQGYRKFQTDFTANRKDFFEQLSAQGQKPKAIVIACCDSRVDPTIVTNADPGDLFIIRNVANLVPPYEHDNSGYHGVSSALEFGVSVLEVSNIIVFGHSNCGGMGSLFQAKYNQSNNFIAKWMDLAKPSAELVEQKYTHLGLEEKINLCSCYSLINSFKNLQTFPWIAQKIAQKKLTLHAWYFDIATGKILYLNQNQEFVAL